MSAAESTSWADLVEEEVDDVEQAIISDTTLNSGLDENDHEHTQTTEQMLSDRLLELGAIPWIESHDSTMQQPDLQDKDSHEEREFVQMTATPQQLETLTLGVPTIRFFRDLLRPENQYIITDLSASSPAGAEFHTLKEQSRLRDLPQIWQEHHNQPMPKENVVVELTHRNEQFGGLSGRKFLLAVCAENELGSQRERAENFFDTEFLLAAMKDLPENPVVYVRFIADMWREADSLIPGQATLENFYVEWQASIIPYFIELKYRFKSSESLCPWYVSSDEIDVNDMVRHVGRFEDAARTAQKTWNSKLNSCIHMFLNEDTVLKRSGPEGLKLAQVLAKSYLEDKVKKVSQDTFTRMRKHSAHKWDLKHLTNIPFALARTIATMTNARDMNLSLFEHRHSLSGSRNQEHVQNPENGFGSSKGPVEAEIGEGSSQGSTSTKITDKQSEKPDTTIDTLARADSGKAAAKKERRKKRKNRRKSNIKQTPAGNDLEGEDEAKDQSADGLEQLGTPVADHDSAFYYTHVEHDVRDCNIAFGTKQNGITEKADRVTDESAGSLKHNVTHRSDVSNFSSDAPTGDDDDQGQRTFVTKQKEDSEREDIGKDKFAGYAEHGHAPRADMSTTSYSNLPTEHQAQDRREDKVEISSAASQKQSLVNRAEFTAPASNIPPKQEIRERRVVESATSAGDAAATSSKHLDCTREPEQGNLKDTLVLNIDDEIVPSAKQEEPAELQQEIKIRNRGVEDYHMTNKPPRAATNFNSSSSPSVDNTNLRRQNSNESSVYHTPNESPRRLIFSSSSSDTTDQFFPAVSTINSPTMAENTEDSLAATMLNLTNLGVSDKHSGPSSQIDGVVYDLSSVQAGKQTRRLLVKRRTASDPAALPESLLAPEGVDDNKSTHSDDSNATETPGGINPLREPYAYQKWCAYVNWRYLEPGQDLHAEVSALPAGWQIHRQPKSWLPTEPAEPNIRAEHGITNAAVLVMNTASDLENPEVPKFVFEDWHSPRILVYPQRSTLVDLRTRNEHPDKLPAAKLRQYQAVELAGFPAWRHDRNSFICRLDSCSTVVEDHETRTQICHGCGTKTVVRYCSIAHLLEDLPNHWEECGAEFLCIDAWVDDSTAPARFNNLFPAIPEISGLRGPAWIKQRAHAIYNGGRYSLFLPSSIVPLSVRFPSPTDDNKFAPRMERLLNLALRDSSKEAGIRLLYRLVRQALRANGTWTTATNELLDSQFYEEFDWEPLAMDERDACECVWSGDRGGSCGKSCVCLVEDVGELCNGSGVEAILEKQEAADWLLRVWRRTGMKEDGWARLRGEDFVGVPELHTQLRPIMGYGWDGLGAYSAELLGGWVEPW